MKTRREKNETGPAEVTAVRRSPTDPPRNQQNLERARATADPGVEVADKTLRRIEAAGAGHPLQPALREQLENRFHVPLEGVRIHQDSQSESLAREVGARAFTYRAHIFLGPGERSDDLPLISHEVAHVIQQQVRPVVQTNSAYAADPCEREAHAASQAVSSGQSFQVRETTAGAKVQKIYIPIVDDIIDWVKDKIWDILEEYVPWLVPILKKGFFTWLKEKVVAALEAAVDLITAPFRLIATVAQGIWKHFLQLIEWVRDAAVAIAKGDCSALTQGAEKIEQAFNALVGPPIKALQAAFKKISGFFENLWERFGAPAWEFLKKVGGAVWQTIKDVAQWIWDKTEPIRDAIGAAWDWIKEKLGIGGDGNSEGGILEWFKAKAAGIWNDYVLPFLVKFKKPLLVIGGVLLLLSPAGPILILGAAGFGLMRGIKWIRDHMRDRQAVIQQRGVLRGVILPGIINGVQRVTAALRKSGADLTGGIVSVISRLNEAAGAVAGTILFFLKYLLDWIISLFSRLLEWSLNLVVGFVEWVAGALTRLLNFLQPVFDFLGQLIGIIGNLLRIPFMLAGRLWRLIPACIRNPIVNFLVRQILRRIPIFREIANTPGLWERIKARAETIVRNIFRDRDFLGALKQVFLLLLDILRVPIQLVQLILQKAVTVWDALLERPIQFIVNVLRAVGAGFGRFFKNILSHLAYGISSWLFGAIPEAGLTLPSSWTDWRGMFNLILQALNITTNHIFELIQRRLGPERTAMLRRMWNVATGAWAWISEAVREGPGALWERLVDKVRDLATALLDAAIDWIMEKVITAVMARLLTLLDPTGIMAVINALVAVYAAIETMVQHVTRVLNIINSVLDGMLNIIRGILDAAAQRIETSLRLALPVAIAFLANFLRLGSLPRRVREAIEKVREKVDQALLWLIDKAIALGGAIVSTVKSAAAAVVEWWKQRRRFRIGRESHTLEFAGEGANATLMVRSTPVTMAQFVLNLKAKNPPPDAATLNKIEAESKTIDDIKKRTGGNFGQADGATIATSLTNIATLLEQAGQPKMPPTKVKWTTQNILGDPIGKRMEANPLSMNAGGNSGSAPFQKSRLWDLVNQRSMTYVLGHLLNHNVFGPGRMENLVPITRQLNTQMSAQGEEDVKRWVLNEQKVVKYVVDADLPSAPGPRTHIPAEGWLPASIRMRVWELNADNSQGASLLDRPLPHVLPPDTPAATRAMLRRLSLNNPGATKPEALRALEELPSIGPERAEALYAAKPFSTWNEVITKIAGVTPELVDEWKGIKTPDVNDPSKQVRLVYLDGDTRWG